MRPFLLGETMTTAALKSFGTLVKRDGTDIKELGDISGPDITRGTIDSTTHDSTGGWQEWVLGKLSAGKVTFKINWLPTDATHSYGAGLLNDIVDGTLQDFDIVYTDTGTTTATFTAYVTGFKIAAPVEGMLTADVELTVTGAVSFA
jgi:predicted secreted protein